jgi:hypothetical protein
MDDKEEKYLESAANLANQMVLLGGRASLLDDPEAFSLEYPIIKDVAARRRHNQAWVQFWERFTEEESRNIERWAAFLIRGGPVNLVPDEWLRPVLEIVLWNRELWELLALTKKS